jgi:hypothetical protein
MAGDGIWIHARYFLYDIFYFLRVSELCQDKELFLKLAGEFYGY